MVPKKLVDQTITCGRKATLKKKKSTEIFRSWAQRDSLLSWCFTSTQIIN